MSYTSDVKKELFLALPKKGCCRRALLFGIFALRALESLGAVTLSLSGDEMRSFVLRELCDHYAVTPSVTRSGGRSGYTLTFRQKAIAAYVEGLSCGSPIDRLPFKLCDECKTAFLRGIFFAAGRVQNPEHTYHLEFSAGERRQALASFLSELGYPPKSTDRRKEKLLYYKDNQSVGDLLSMIGLSRAAFLVINTAIEKQYRCEASRRANCETGNIKKAVEASLQKIELLEALFASGKASHLPPELYETARLRLEYRDLSLSQLAMQMSPPITKSGLNHRLEKLTEMAKQLLHAGNENQT